VPVSQVCCGIPGEHAVTYQDSLPCSEYIALTCAVLVNLLTSRREQATLYLRKFHRNDIDSYGTEFNRGVCLTSHESRLPRFFSIFFKLIRGFSSCQDSISIFHRLLETFLYHMTLMWKCLLEWPIHIPYIYLWTHPSRRFMVVEGRYDIKKRNHKHGFEIWKCYLNKDAKISCLWPY
jgi:hypothetical protein